MKIAFISKTDQGRSQMAYAFALREAQRRKIETDVELMTGGIEPGDRILPAARDAMQEAGLDLAGRSPKKISFADLESADIVVAVGFAFEKADIDAETVSWDVGSPAETDAGKVRDRIEDQVESLFDRIEDQV